MSTHDEARRKFLVGAAAGAVATGGMPSEVLAQALPMAPSQQAFFNTLRTHTMESMFADPVYGGNKDFAGWKLVGFPGAHPAFTAADMQSKEAFAGAAYLGLQSQAPRTRG